MLSGSKNSMVLPFRDRKNRENPDKKGQQYLPFGFLMPLNIPGFYLSLREVRQITTFIWDSFILIDKES
jgi:hypothetical protein